MEEDTGLEDVGAAELPPGDSACRHSLGSVEGSLGIGEDSLSIGEDCNDCTEAPGA